MAYKTQAKTVMLNALAGVAKYVSLHTSYPATSDNELSGGGYSRQQVSFNTPSSGAMTISGQPTFSVPAGATVAAVGFWSASSAGTLYADAQVTAETYANPGTYRIESATLDLNK